MTAPVRAVASASQVSGTLDVASTGAAHAVLIDNGSTTIDSATGLEWLDLTSTAGQSYNSVIAGAFVTTDGYNVATAAELCALLTSNVAPLPGCGGALVTAAIGNAAANTFIGLFGDTGAAQGRVSSSGWFDSGQIGSSIVGLACVDGGNGVSTFGLYFGSNIFGTAGAAKSVSQTGAHGIWSVRQTATIPEPSTMLLLGVGLVGLIGAGRRRAWKASIRTS